jgi:hypothetical protein
LSTKNLKISLLGVGSQNLILLLKHHAKFQNPMITPSGKKVKQKKKEERKKKNINSGHLDP